MQRTNIGGTGTLFIQGAIVLGALAMFLLAGCHTTAGFGQDLQSTGRNIQHSANQANK